MRVNRAKGWRDRSRDGERHSEAWAVPDWRFTKVAAVESATAPNIAFLGRKARAEVAPEMAHAAFRAAFGRTRDLWNGDCRGLLANASAIGFDWSWRCCCRRSGGDPLMAFSMA
jgi:hypothetical protein